LPIDAPATMSMKSLKTYIKSSVFPNRC
jgi:hypothetical protein